MSYVNLDAVRSLAIAGIVTLYATVMLAAASGVSGIVA